MKRKWTILLAIFIALSGEPLAASIIKKPPTKTGDAAYKDLICTDEDKSIIYNIISTIAETSKISLLFKQSQLKELGAQIDHVHPLKFLGVIFSDDYLKSCMFLIERDSFKWSGFMDGLAPSLTSHQQSAKLEQYFKDFAAQVKVPVEGMVPFFQNMDWYGLVDYLIHS
jgi:hypothetical protein